MNIWHDIDSRRITPEKFICCIEISKGGKNKYELDKETGLLILDRVLYTSTHYPANYGFIPRTLADDDDPLDVLVMCQEEILPMTLVNCSPIGVIKMVDDDSIDEKIIAVPTRDPSLLEINDISELPKHTYEEFSHFFEVYKNLENGDTSVIEVCGREEAVKVIANCIELYKKSFKRY